MSRSVAVALPRPPKAFPLKLAMTLTLLVLSLWFVVATARAQEARVITFEEAVRIALEQNVELRQTANNADLQAREVFQSRMNFLPSLSFNSNGSRGSGFAQDQAGRNIAYSTTNVNGSFSAGINLFNGFADVAALKQAQHQQDASEYTYDRARQNVVFDVATTFVDLINANEQIRIREENLEALRQQLAQIEEFTRVGARPISDLYQQQAAVAQAELEVLNAERLAQITQTQLIQILQLNPFGEYSFVAPEVRADNLPIQVYDLEQLLQAAFAERSDLQAQEARIDAARQGIRIARSSYWPTIGFGGSLRSNFSPDADAGLFNQIDLNRGTSLGFQVQLPIFSQFSRGTSVQRAEVQYRNAELDLEGMRQQVALQVRQAYLDYLTTQKQLDVAEKQVISAQQALEAAEERYNVGAATLVELSQARADYVQAVSNQAQAKYGALFQGKLIEYYIGQLDPSQSLLE